MTVPSLIDRRNYRDPDIQPQADQILALTDAGSSEVRWIAQCGPNQWEVAIFDLDEAGNRHVHPGTNCIATHCRIVDFAWTDIAEMRSLIGDVDAAGVPTPS